MPSQTVIYNKRTLSILSIARNRYIRHRRELQSFSESTPLPDIAFFYEDADVTLDALKDTVRIIAHGHPPQVMGPDGTFKAFDKFLRNRRHQIQAASNILCKLEGGMGDQILQAEAALQFRQVYPDKKLTLAPYPRYAALLQSVIDLPNVLDGRNAPPGAHFDLTVDTHTPYITDPRGGLHGKASLYGASIGLNQVRSKARLLLPDPLHHAADETLSLAGVRPYSRIIGFHIRSGSGHSKCWNTEPAQECARLFLDDPGTFIALIGDAKDWSLSGPRIIRIAPPMPWTIVAALIAKLALLVCIDSGPMHLARALSTPVLILWGGTSFRDILGREKELCDFRIDIPCINRVCHSCPLGNSKCMTQIKAHDVHTQALALLQMEVERRIAHDRQEYEIPPL
jgi:hypothetical protein